MNTTKTGNGQFSSDVQEILCQLAHALKESLPQGAAGQLKLDFGGKEFVEGVDFVRLGPEPSSIAMLPLRWWYRDDEKLEQFKQAALRNEAALYKRRALVYN
jgi:hypothetical protein